jgi:methyl-accepting chemotaxis protein
MKLRSLLLSVVSALAVSVTVTTGVGTYQAFGQRQAAIAFLAVNEAAELLIKSAGDWAVERGLTNAPLNAIDPVAADRRAQIAERRQIADRAFKAGLERARQIPEMAGAQPMLSEAEQAFRAFEQFRRRVDDALAKPESAREPEVVKSFVPMITKLIGIAQDLRLVMETQARAPEANLVQLVQVRHLVAEMAENAGRQRAVLGGVIAAGEAMPIKQIGWVAQAHGRVLAGWDVVRVLRNRADTPTEVGAAIDTVEQEYFKKYDQLREAVFAGTEKGVYPVQATEFVDRSTAAINTILKLAKEIGDVARGSAQASASRNGAVLLVNLSVLLGSLILTLASFWVVVRRVVVPLTAMTEAMGKLAAGDKGIEIAGGERSDEIGDMAKAVDVFKRSMIEADRLAAEQAAERHVREARAAALESLTKDFERKVGELVGAVSSAATEMEATAQSMSATAAQTNQQSTAVAAASEQTSANVQTVATATEELASSIREIGRQVEQSAKIAEKAVNDARTTDATVQELAESAQRIGEVVDLINNIAGQTNLLALNATIEAARAGEAGKGFAVVASEVKGLANQTAKATEEIAGQVGQVQNATQRAVDAIRKIGDTIQEISTIASSIASAVEEQGAATQEIARNVQQAAQGTQEVTSNIAGVQQAATETGEAADKVLGAAGQLSQQAARLTSEVGEFISGVNAA